MNLKDILIKDVMVKEPFTIGEDEPFSRVVDIFKLHNTRHLPVLDNNRILKGIITQRDLYRITSPHKTMEGTLVYDKQELDKFILKRVMTREICTLSENNSLYDCIDFMVRKKYGCIPIVDEKNYLLGIVTQIDALRAIEKIFK